jgi:hypothetical protein
VFMRDHESDKGRGEDAPEPEPAMMRETIDIDW